MSDVASPSLHLHALLVLSGCTKLTYVQAPHGMLYDLL